MMLLAQGGVYRWMLSEDLSRYSLLSSPLPPSSNHFSLSPFPFCTASHSIPLTAASASLLAATSSPNQPSPPASPSLPAASSPGHLASRGSGRPGKDVAGGGGRRAKRARRAEARM